MMTLASTDGGLTPVLTDAIRWLWALEGRRPARSQREIGSWSGPDRRQAFGSSRPLRLLSHDWKFSSLLPNHVAPRGRATR